MDGWKDGCMHGRMDGYINGWMDRWKEGWVDREIFGRQNRQNLVIDWLIDWIWWRWKKRELKVSPVPEHETGWWRLLQWDRGHPERNRFGADEAKEVSFDQDKCEVSLLCLGLFQNFRAERERQRGILKSDSQTFLKLNETKSQVKGYRSSLVTGTTCHWLLLFGRQWIEPLIPSSSV